jgi:GNAT superfamily N-acetyltransferase
MPDFVIRRALEGDAQGIADIFNGLDLEDLGEDALCPFDEHNVQRDAIGDGAILATEVAIARGRVIGAAAHNLAYHAETASPARWLEMLFVEKEWRSHGVGLALMRAVSSAALEGGCDAVFWGVRQNNDQGARFYDSIGAGNEQANIRVLLQDDLTRLAGSRQ